MAELRPAGAGALVSPSTPGHARPAAGGGLRPGTAAGAAAGAGVQGARAAGLREVDEAARLRLLPCQEARGHPGVRAMPRQNRVTPWGEIVAMPERGTLMGNRGLLHDAEGQIMRPWRERRWIICLLDFKGRRRSVMSPGLYTELFFLDEATALAAGHRPCAECRRERFNAFRDAWLKGNGGAAPVTAPDIDRRLHEERLGPGGT